MTTPPGPTPPSPTTVSTAVEVDTSAEHAFRVFTELRPGRTRVVLTHRHLDRHGEGWEGMRDAVGSGWSLTGFAAAAQQPPGGAALTDQLPTITDDEMRARVAKARPCGPVVGRPAHRR